MASIADKVAVMYAGEIVEYGTVEEIFYEPKHPYTRSLLSSLPQLADAMVRFTRFLVLRRHFIHQSKGMPLHCVLTMPCQLTLKKKHQLSMCQILIGLRLVAARRCT